MSKPKNNEKILLSLLPYWDPQIPPMGIVSLKTFLEEHGYNIKTVDANIHEEFSQLHRRYFNILEEFIPREKQGNFHNIGQDVMRNHMMSHIHYDDENRYIDLVKTLVSKTFFTEIPEEGVRQLIQTLRDFYRVLEQYFLDLLSGEKPGILGVSVYRGNLAASMFALRLTRQHYPHIKTVMGGAVFAGELAVGSENLEYFLKKVSYIDKIIAGEGEILFLKYLRDELPETQQVYTLEHIDGETLDLDRTTPIAQDFSDLDLGFYPHLPAYASRSCPFQCSFCTETVYWGKYRKKNASQVVNEMTALYQKHKSQLFLMCDSLLNPVIDDLSNALIESKLSLYWDGYLRADPQVCDRDNTLQWRRGGFYRARLGIESGSPHVLELMGKKISPEQIKAAVSCLADAGIKTTTYWVIGHPGETEENFRQTLDLLAEMRDDIYEAWCSPFSYYKTGQVNSGQWAGKSELLYPAWAKDMLVTQTWIVKVPPSRQDAYRRMNCFVQHCKELGIPNPFSLVEFYQADERWKKLHRNAVPSIVEFENKDVYIDENKTVKKVVAASKKLNPQMNFDF